MDVHIWFPALQVGLMHGYPDHITRILRSEVLAHPAHTAEQRDKQKVDSTSVITRVRQDRERGVVYKSTSP